MTPDETQAVAKTQAQAQIQEALKTALNQNPHMMILGYITERGDIAVVKYCREIGAEALLYVGIQCAVLSQAQKNFIRDASPETPPPGALSN